MTLPATAASYLNIYLGPFDEYLQRPDVTDVYVNKPGEAWIETLGGATERFDAPEVTESLLWRLSRQIAAITHQGISREQPLLAATLPNGARVQVIAPPATRGPMAMAIRKHVAADLSLDGYHAMGAFAQTRAEEPEDAADAELTALYAAEDWPEFLKAAVRARKTILVSGGTSTGKTTFLNALLAEIEPDERLILVEDTPELVCRRENWLGLVALRGGLGEAKLNADDLLVASLRMRPDRIILGELRGPEAFTFLRAVNTGHPGSLTTIHADSPKRAVEQLTLLLLQSGAGLRQADIARYIETAVDIFVQLERRKGERSVSAVRWARRPKDPLAIVRAVRARRS
jgi:type IV secretion system protein VirB11